MNVVFRMNHPYIIFETCSRKRLQYVVYEVISVKLDIHTFLLKQALHFKLFSRLWNTNTAIPHLFSCGLFEADGAFSVNS